MEIYIVKPGDTIESIANMFGVTTDKLILENELDQPSQLVSGQMIVISYPTQTHTVREGETLESIAAIYNITIGELLRNNAFLPNIQGLYPGLELNISFNRTRRIETYGYANSFINRNLLAKTLPYLTYLPIFNYRISESGQIIQDREDSDIIEMAIIYGVLPLLHLSTLTVQGEFDVVTTYRVLIDEDFQDIIIENTLKIIRNKGYYGVIISAQSIDEQNQYLFTNYARRFSERLGQEGYQTLITINPNINTIEDEVIFEVLDYGTIAQAVDSILFLEYMWGLDIIPPGPIISVREQDVFLDYALTQTDPQHIVVGIPTFGYNWELPYISGYSNSEFLTEDNVINLARNVGAYIQFDEVSQNSYFYYEIENGDTVLNVVWVVNAETVDSLVKLSLAKDIDKIGIWNIMYFDAQLWLVINSQYEIVKHF